MALDTNFDINRLCHEMHTSKSQLFRKTKALIGVTPNQYINQIRYQIARELLENQKYSTVKAVAYHIGFKDEKYFSRNFKKRFGKNPSEYLN